MMFGAFTIRVPADGWQPEGWDPSPGGREEARHHGERLGGQRDPDPAVLPALGGAVLQRHRRHRHPRAGGADDPGLLPRRRGHLERERHRRRAASSGCCRSPTWPGRFGWSSHVRPDRAQADLHALPRGRDGALPAARDRRRQLDRPVRAARRGHPVLLRRRLRHRAGVPARPVRHLPGRRDPRSAADRLVGGGRGRAAHRQPLPRRPGHPGRAHRGRLPPGARSRWSACSPSASSPTC